jgi:CBS domain-containing protein
VMTESPVTIYPDATISQAAVLMLDNEVSGLPVEKDETIVGMITSRDIQRYFSEQDIKAKVRDLMTTDLVNVHRHHTIAHVLEQMNTQGVARVLVYEDNKTPVGIVTRSALTFSNMMGPKDEMETKDIKMTRKDSAAGRKQYRYIKEMPLVAEDIMNSPIITIDAETKAVDAAKTMVEKHVCGMPVMENGDIVGFFSTDEIVAEIGRW